jgi:hypothetical protein
MKSSAPLADVMTGAMPPGHSTLGVEIKPSNDPEVDCLMRKAIVVVPLTGAVKVRTQVCALVSVTNCSVPFTGVIVFAVVQVPLSNSLTAETADV